ncbi:restriction endonuclease subunit S [bacterium]|nr:restriction endonuclease subunit S [bacterium]
MKSKYINGSSEHITIEGLNNSSAKLLFPGTILFSIIADIGKTSFLNVKAATNQQIAAVILDNILNKEFIYYFLKYSAIYANKQSYGTAYNSINIKILKNMLIPFPPLEEQERIVAKIKKLEPLVNEYEKLKRDYDSIYSNLGMKLRFSVIKAAIDGNLTSHKLNDMSVFDLVKSIKKEHINLLSTNKIHKQKHDCDILLKNGLYTLVTNGEEIPVDPKIINSLPKN